MCKRENVPLNKGGKEKGGLIKEDFELEMLHLVEDILPEGTICTCCTQSMFTHYIKTHYSIIKKKKAYKQTLDKVEDYVGKEHSGKTRQMYRVVFSTKKKDA